LRRRYTDINILDQIQEVFYDKLNEIKTRARKFAKLIEKKFGAKGLPLHIVLKESKRYKEKYQLSDVEFDEFKKQYEKLMNSRYPDGAGDQPVELLPNTSMAQLFGDLQSVDGLTIKDSDYPVIQEIIKMYSMTRSNHAAVIIQTMQYEDCDLQALQGTFDPSKHNIACAIHPVIAAMFIPKIQFINEQFLFSNIAYIIKSKFNKEPINNVADQHLLFHMINDSNDVVCSAESPIKDLRLRANLQNNLWNNVLNLRSGKFYECIGNDFMNAIDECKISLYDAPDLLYIGDEGVILKRLIAAFSFRPIVISTNPIFGTYGNSNVMNFPVISNRVIAVPLLTLRLPTVGQDNSQIKLKLEDAITQSQTYIENGMFVPKTQTVVYTNGVVIFHVPRRTLSPGRAYEKLISPKVEFNQLPAHILSYEQINDTEIEISETLRIASEIYHLRSAVILETEKDNIENIQKNLTRKIVLTTSAIIRQNIDEINSKYFIYAPTFANQGGSTDKVGAITSIDSSMDSNNDPIDILSKSATIFFYTKNYNA
jgi:hypothetical protein